MALSSASFFRSGSRNGHIAARCCEVLVVLWSALSSSGFRSIRSRLNGISGDDAQQFLTGVLEGEHPWGEQRRPLAKRIDGSSRTGSGRKFDPFSLRVAPLLPIRYPIGLSRSRVIGLICHR
jgi:hypothetical protein